MVHIFNSLASAKGKSSGFFLLRSSVIPFSFRPTTELCVYETRPSAQQILRVFGIKRIGSALYVTPFSVTAGCTNVGTTAGKITLASIIDTKRFLTIIVTSQRFQSNTVSYWVRKVAAFGINLEVLALIFVIFYSSFYFFD